LISRLVFKEPVLDSFLLKKKKKGSFFEFQKTAENLPVG